MNKKIISVSVLAATLITTNAFAYNNGPYIGGALGWGQVTASGATDLNDTVANDNGVAGGFFAGYKFNQYFALQTDYTKFSDVNATGSEASLAYLANGNVKTYSVDVVLKGMLPIADGFGLFATLGTAYLNQQANYNYTSNIGNGSAISIMSVIAPTFGIGASYEINKNLVTELSWSRIQADIATNANLSNTNFVGLNISYHFD